MLESTNIPESTPPPAAIHIYAKVDKAFALRIGEDVFAEITDPNKTGSPDPSIIRTIEEAGSLDLNIALYDGRTGETKVLEGVAAKLAEAIATDMMVVCVDRMRPDIVMADGDSLSESCMRRIDKLVGATNVGRSAIPAHGGWHIVELMGQKRYSAFVTEVYVAGQKVLQLEIPTDNEGKNRVTKFVGSRGAIYAMTRCEERLALGVAQHNQPIPFDSWEIRRMGMGEEGVGQTDRLLGPGHHDDDSPPDSQEGDHPGDDDSEDDDPQF